MAPAVKVSIFLSYIREDQPDVEALYQRLQAAGFAPWMDVHDLLPGQAWWPGIQRAIDAAHFVIVCLSPHAVEKRGISQREQVRALDYAEGMLADDIYLIPLRLAPCDAPERLRKYQWVDMFQPDGWDRLLAGLRAGLERRGLPMPSPVDTTPSTAAPAPTTAAPPSTASSTTPASTSPPTPSASAPSPSPPPPSPLAAFRQAFARRRLAVLWGAAPFPPADDGANPAVTANAWRAAAADLPGLALDLAGLPPVDILSLDPTARPLDACDAIDRDAADSDNPGSPAAIVLSAGDLPEAGRHTVYQLAGDLATGTDLVLTPTDMRRRLAHADTRRWLLDPWRDIAAATDAVVIAHADPASPAFRAWWAEGLADALAGLALHAVGPQDAPWPNGVTVVAPDWAAFAAAWRAASAPGGPPSPPTPHGAIAPGPLTPGQRRRLEQRLSELQTNHDTLGRRIAALDTDIGRELDSMRRQVLEERRAEIAAEREAVATEMDDIERRLGR